MARNGNFERPCRDRPREQERAELEALWKQNCRCRKQGGPLFPVIEDEAANGALGLNGDAVMVIWARKGFERYRRRERDGPPLNLITSMVSSYVDEGHSVRSAMERAVAELGVAGSSFDKTVECLRKRISATLKHIRLY